MITGKVSVDCTLRIPWARGAQSTLASEGEVEIVDECFVYTDTDAYELPETGFKIHISATVDDYEDILRLATEYLSHKQVYWKVLKSREEFIKNISKTGSPAESGKLFTVYPRDNDEARCLMNELSIALQGFDGVYILSDRNYRGSNVVFYRFGFFTVSRDLTLHHDGETWQDYQKPYFDMPSWIQDPFCEQGDGIGEVDDDSPLKKYHFTKIIRRNNGGNIYRASCGDREVLVKESRPYILDSETLTARSLRENEWDRCSQLDQSLFLRPVEKFSAWINEYFVYDYVVGETLASWFVDFDLFNHLSQGTINQFMSVVRQILAVIESAHEKGLILDDIQPDNFILDQDHRIRFIDLESVQTASDPQRIISKTRGYYLEEWNCLTGEQRDLRKAGEIILYLLSQLNLSEGQDRDVPETIVLVQQLFRRFGYDTTLGKLLIYLLIDGTNAKDAIKLADEITFSEIKPVVNFFGVVDEECLQSQQTYCELLTALTQNQIVRFGLDGLCGYLWKLSRFPDISQDFIEATVLKIKSNLAGAYLRVGHNNYSPYVLNGSSGVGLFLMEYDFDRYQDTICTIADGMTFKVGKAVDFGKGLAGVAYFLIKLYERVREKRYLQWADEQLDTCGLFTRSGLLYNYETKKYETDFLRGYAGLEFVRRERRGL